jgi:hypothetical protein
VSHAIHLSHTLTPWRRLEPGGLVSVGAGRASGSFRVFARSGINSTDSPGSWKQAIGTTNEQEHCNIAEKSPHQKILVGYSLLLCFLCVDFILSASPACRLQGMPGWCKDVLIVEPGKSRWTVIGDFGELIRTLEWGCRAERLAAPPANILAPFEIRGAKALELAYELSTPRTTSSQEE